LESRNKLDVAENSPVGKQSAVLLHVPDSAPEKNRRLRLNVAFADNHVPALGLYKPVEAAEKRRLSRAAFADERSRATRQDLNANVVESDDFAEVMRDIARRE
jgi:prepilin-type processing-associated H-X9-DG protein